MRRLGWWAAMILAACGGTGESDRGRDPAPAAAAVPAPPADSLVFATGSGVQVWFTDGRAARDSAGGRCDERGVELRTDTTRIRVPLLYTGRPPTPLGKDAIRAELWRDCRPIAIYRVDLATGRPTKLDER